MSRPSRVSDETFAKAVSECVNFTEVCEKLGFGKSSKHMKNRALNLGLDLSHFSPKGKSQVRRPYDRKPTEKLTSNREIKARLIRDGIWKNQCFICHINEWLGETLVLQVDHIDGNPKNNKLDNLRLLCPNCHSQTETYAGKRRNKCL